MLFCVYKQIIETKYDQSNMELNRKAIEWINDYQKANRWFRKSLQGRDVETLLAENNDLVKISNFLPGKVAESISYIVASVDASVWRRTEAHRNLEENNIAHTFESCKCGSDRHVEDTGYVLNENEYLASIFRLFSLIMPRELYSFSAGRYGVNGESEYEEGQVLPCVPECVHRT